jgi:hypothetical protein
MIGPSLVTQGPGYLLAVEHKDVDALQFASLASEARARTFAPGRRCCAADEARRSRSRRAQQRARGLR